MRLVMFQSMALGAAILSCSSAFAVTLEGGAVAAPDQYGAQVAADILKKGGNAVDAAVATAFTLAVTYPEAGNIGGGGFMTLYVDGKAYFLDYREVAPKAATRNMYLDEKGEVIENLSLVGVRARRWRTGHSNGLVGGTSKVRQVALERAADSGHRLRQQRL